MQSMEGQEREQRCGAPGKSTWHALSVLLPLATPNPVDPSDQQDVQDPRKLGRAWLLRATASWGAGKHRRTAFDQVGWQRGPS